MNLEQLLQQIAAGTLDPAKAAELMRSEGMRDLGFARIDIDRPRRRAFPEVIFCPSKTPEQVAAIAGTLRAAGQLENTMRDMSLAALREIVAGAEAAGIALGARVPIALTSRADSARERRASAALAVLVAARNRQRG